MNLKNLMIKKTPKDSIWQDLCNDVCKLNGMPLNWNISLQNEISNV